MTKLYKNAEQKGLNIGWVFRKCKHPGCLGAATEDTLGFCVKHLQSSPPPGHPVGDVTVIMDAVRIRSRDKKPHSTRNRRKKSPSVHIGDSVRGLDMTRSKDTQFVLHLHKDDRGTHHQSHDPDLEESSDLINISCVESHAQQKRCIGPGCFNMGSCDFNGLCCDCYEILLLARQQTGRLGASKCLGGQGWFGGHLESVHSLCSGGPQSKHNLGDSRREEYPVPSDAQCSLKSSSLNIQEGSDPKEQSDLIDFSIRETPNQRQLETRQTGVCLVDLSLCDRNLTDTVDNTTNLIDLSLTETAQCEEKDSRKSDVMNSSTYSFEHLAAERKTSSLGDDEIDRNGTQVSEATLDLRLPNEALQTSNNRTDNHGFDLQPEMELSPHEVTKQNEVIRTLSSRSCNHGVHAQPAMNLLPSEVSKTVNSRPCNHEGGIYPEMKILNTKPSGQMKDRGISYRSSKEHRRYRNKDVKCSNIPRDRKPIKTKEDQNHTDFERLIEDIEEQSKMSVHKCLTSDCENFGNSRCMGLCNSCYKTLTST